MNEIKQINEINFSRLSRIQPFSLSFTETNEMNEINQTNEINQINQTNETNQIVKSVALTPVILYPSPMGPPVRNDVPKEGWGFHWLIDNDVGIWDIFEKPS